MAPPSGSRDRLARALDYALAGSIFLIDMLSEPLKALLQLPDVQVRRFDVWTVVFALAVGGAMLWRRSHPLALFAVVLVTALANPGVFSQASGLALGIAIYHVAAYGSRRTAWIAGAGTLALATVVTLTEPDADLSSLTFPLIVVVLPWGLGSFGHSRRLYLESLRDRAERLEREREERARLAVLSERSRIARELHDVVAHHVSLIGVQAGAARAAYGTDPSATLPALQAIEDSSRQAVLEMKQLVGTLRADEEAAGLTPQPGLADVEELVSDAVEQGLHVRYEMNGASDDLGSVLGLTVYRIVQEALTNVTRHSRADSAEVLVEIQPEHLHIRVSDPGPSVDGVSGLSTGNGLIGMEERVAMFGGQLHADPMEDGFVVDAVIPRDGS